MLTYNFVIRMTRLLRRFLAAITILLGCSLGWAQTPTLVQHVSCPDSRNTGNAQSSSPVYTCPLPEPAQAGNTIVVGVKSYNTGSFSVSDDKSNTYGAAKGSVVDGNSAYLAIYVSTNVVGGTRTISFNQTSVNADFTEVSVSEYYNVTAVDTSHCSGWSSGSSSTISAGSLTPTVAGDLIWQYAINSGAGGASPNAVSSFSAGTSPSGISWQLLGTSLHDGDAVQAGVYNSTATITPQFTSGSSEDWSSCAVALKPGNAGAAPTSPFRIIHMLHEQVHQGDPSPVAIEFPSSGNLVIMADASGATAISSICDGATGTGSCPGTSLNTWASTGAMTGGGANTGGSQIYYAGNATTSNSLTLRVVLSGTVYDSTMMMYDIVGAASAPFDVDSCPSGAYSNASCGGNQLSNVSSFTTCTNCLIPSGVTGGSEVIIGAAQWAWDTAIGVTTTPSGGLFDAATYTGNSVNGPEYVDQNGGWFHLYTSTTTPISNTYIMSLGSTPEGWWGGGLAAFKSAQSDNQLLPPTGLTAVVH
jgi:hypothetical protein